MVRAVGEATEEVLGDVAEDVPEEHGDPEDHHVRLPGEYEGAV